MRPNTSSKMPHTMTDVVDEPVAGIDPMEPPDGLPPVDATVVDTTTGDDAPTITKVAVRVPLVAPVEVTVYEPGVVGAAVKVTVAAPRAAACSGRTRPATGSAHVAVALVGVDCGWVTVIVSPTRQFGCVTL